MGQNQSRTSLNSLEDQKHHHCQKQNKEQDQKPRMNSDPFSEAQIPLMEIENVVALKEAQNTEKEPNQEGLNPQIQMGQPRLGAFDTRKVRPRQKKPRLLQLTLVCRECLTWFGAGEGRKVFLPCTHQVCSGCYDWIEGAITTQSSPPMLCPCGALTTHCFSHPSDKRGVFATSAAKIDGARRKAKSKSKKTKPKRSDLELDQSQRQN